MSVPRTREPAKAQAVRAMFAGIAHRYDFLNHLLSLNLDRGWRREAVRAVGVQPGDLALDACTGTADLALLLAQAGARVIAADFCGAMLRRGVAKARGAGRSLVPVEADTERLPFRPGSFDVATVAFGIRNLEEPRRGLTSLAEALRPGGRLAVLEFSRPRNRAFRALYYFYFLKVLPRIGAAVSGKVGPYSYLPSSVLAFPEPAELARVLESAGLEEVRIRPLSLGIVSLITGRRRTLPGSGPPPAP